MNESFTWTQKTPWGALSISASVDGVHHVRLVAGQTRKTLDGGAPPKVREIAGAFERFFTGDPYALEDVPVDLSSVENDFQRRVLSTLRKRIGPGKTISYGGLAELVGHPGAARAVGTAMARNPVPIVVPCHRVLASNGTLGGYGGGLEMKETLLRLEGALL
jgi:methylated-DNA-[protein]-cysteine S-methyltransferase